MMKTEIVPIADLTPDPANARQHSERNLSAIVDSLRAFGQQKPIVVDRRGVVVAGNGTMAAAKSLGWTEIAVVRSDLDATQATAFGIADNRTAELAAWDYEVLQSLVDSLGSDGFDVKSIGFDETDLESIMGVDFKSENLAGNDGYEANPDRHTVQFRGEAWPSIQRVLDESPELPDGEADAIVAMVLAYAATKSETESEA
jgi:ParB-like chromosome segregation protein Spo0J